MLKKLLNNLFIIYLLSDTFHIFLIYLGIQKYFDISCNDTMLFGSQGGDCNTSHSPLGPVIPKTLKMGVVAACIWYLG